MRAPVLIPWQTDFLTALADDLARREDLARTLVVFPHNRPKRYVKKLLAEHPALHRPCLLPEMVSLADLITTLRRELDPRPLKRANTLDLVELLRTIVDDLRIKEGGLLAHLPRLSRETFLPWGLRLAALLEDLLRQDVEPANLMHMEGEVADYAAALLEQLASIYAAYVAGVQDRGWTTPGLDWQTVLAHQAELSALLGDRPVLAAGFYGLSRAEDRLFRGLWEDDRLEIWLHSDPALANGDEPHWAVEEHTQWLKRWQVRPRIPSGLDYDPDHRPEVRFIEGFDRHSQLEGLRTELAEWEGGGAVILPDESALLPVLQHLPDRDVNISMGYPLDRTPLAGLLETIMDLQQVRDRTGAYPPSDLIRLIRHPYLRLLGEGRPLRSVLHVLEATLRQGELTDPRDWDPDWNDPPLADTDRGLAEPLLAEVLDRCLTGFEGVGSLEGLALALDRFCAMLREQGADLWHTYLVDAECLFRLTASVVPQLRGADMAPEPLARPLLFAMLRRLVAAERVSFEPEPLSGLQVMGMLETRLLRFERLFVMDAVEDNLPGTPPFDPLLPDPLRRVLALPDSRQRNNVAGYNFHRLLKGADKAVIAYPAGDTPGVLDGKSVRSRYVEELLWEREQERGALIESGDPLITPVTFRAGTIPHALPSVPKTGAVGEALLEKLAKRGLSPSSLDKYLSCPKQFFYSYVTGMREDETEAGETLDRRPFGTLLHGVLQEFFAPFVGTTVHPGNLDPERLAGLFHEAFDADPDCRAYPRDVRLALRLGGEKKLREYLDTQDAVDLVGLERSFETELSGGGLTVPFRGQIDRLEGRDQGLVVLDYKTGGGSKPRQNFWADPVWERLETPDFADPALLEDVERVVRSVQLPAYLYLCHRDGLLDLSNAGLVELAKGGGVKWLFGKNETPEERREAVADMTPRLLGFLLDHMVRATEFPARPGTRCDWCGYRHPCGK